jgi:predicted RNase H-like nuclease (RuvC/YqgF family)
MTNKQGILIGALGSYFNELIAENLRPIVERIDSVAAFTRMTNELLNGDIEKRISTLDQRINELLNGDIEERISTLDQRLDELEKRLAKLEEKLDADFAWGRQAIHKIEELSELEKRVKMIDTRTANLGIEYDLLPEHAANLVFEKLGGSPTIYIESDQFRRRIFDIVDMALQQATLSIKGSE